jgi:ribosomal protein S27E
MFEDIGYIRCAKCRGLDITIVFNQHNLVIYRCDHCGHRWIGPESGQKEKAK